MSDVAPKKATRLKKGANHRTADVGNRVAQARGLSASGKNRGILPHRWVGWYKY